MPVWSEMLKFCSQVPIKMLGRFSILRRITAVATVRGTCPQCGDVTFASTGMEIRLCETTRRSEYRFNCPVCEILVIKPAPDKVIEALTGVGVPVVRWSLPAEMAEPRLGPPINWDDILLFHMALESEDWRAELAGLRTDR